jgi:hypothetical protein
VQKSGVELQRVRFDVSNPDPLDLTHAHIIVAPVVKSGGFSVGVPGHALRNLDASAVGEIIRDPGRAESVTVYRGFDTSVGSTAAHHVPDIGAS